MLALVVRGTYLEEQKHRKERSERVRWCSGPILSERVAKLLECLILVGEEGNQLTRFLGSH